MSLSDEIREALSQATPGPWRRGGGGWPDGVVADRNNICGAWGEGRGGDGKPPHKVSAEADMHLIAQAPTWLAALCDEVERLGEQNDGLYEAVKLLAAERDRYREALEWIAKGGVPFDPNRSAYGDVQDIARTTLKESNE